MKKILKGLALGTGVLALAGASTYGLLWANLPSLDGKLRLSGPRDPVTLARDELGTAIIHANDRADAAFALGFAHGQDRFFQMDLLRRNAAGELSALFGDAALPLDRKHRSHQFRKRAAAVIDKLAPPAREVLRLYTLGVNAALDAQKIKGFEYLLINTTPEPWSEEDSLLAIYSMYLDLQAGTVEREQVLTYIQQSFGQSMVDFITQTDPLQAALDGSTLPLSHVPVPTLPEALMQQSVRTVIEQDQVVGSNNWAVTGELTTSGHAMLSDDMHLSLNVPVIWYRTQLNYQSDGDDIQVTGVSLPGAPAIVVGTNGHIAWGFTNGYIDTADWVILDDKTPVTQVNETLKSPTGDHNFAVSVSDYGPVTQIGDQNYALSWVAHQPYAVNMELMALETAKNVDSGLAATERTGIPVQNMLIVDSQGNAAWRLTGAIPARSHPSSLPISEAAYPTAQWQAQAGDVPVVKNPEHQRLWSANSRVVSAEDNARFGNGGYAIGSRSVQIRDKLMASDSFNESDFMAMQLDNRAIFMTRWHNLLLATLKAQPQQFADDIRELEQWQACACSESVGYTLVSHFRSQLIDALFAPIQTSLAKENMSLRRLKRDLEPAIWQLLEQQPQDWLPGEYKDWQSWMQAIYIDTRAKLLAKYSDKGRLTDLNWGKVNALKIQHPFSRQFPQLSWLLDMPVVTGFGGSFEPAVQTKSFGASQRFIVQPGREQHGIMSIPGGQSGNPISQFYRRGFDDYANHRGTPLLPGAPVHTMTIQPL
ncbi:MAG: penicillin acylase family protein [Shewanella sp.]|nr:penicillin acylase family protein [Shewanella sp.]MCF1430719.1 penicillin acylase family protein [Shewanella sp.]MCF1437900.1 penicillin acylase family protein [Shewanella sp.]MCF1458518.1 penicillin acylase family protein [Shewanella sp.]